MKLNKWTLGLAALGVDRASVKSKFLSVKLFIMRQLYLTLVCVACMVTQLAFGQSTITNGVFWNDTQGNRIEAHGGGIMQYNGKWYWIGENRASGTRTNLVNLYSSSDLVNWKFEKGVITTSTQSQLGNGSRWIERPKLLYCSATGQFVIWCHWEGASYAVSQYAVFTSSTINGSYTFNHAEQPMGYMSRDCNVFKDDDGKAYFVTSSNNNYDLELFQMTSDYLNIASHVSTIYNGDHREAPVIFKRSGVYYLLTSAATGWDSNQGQYSTATSLSGSWTARTNFGSSNTYDTQPATFIQVTGSQTTTFIYCGDRWQDPDLPSSKYIWMPITFSGTSMSLPNATTWTINLSTGVVSGGGGGGTLANGTYKIINRNSGKALDVSKQATTNSTLVGQYSYWGGSGQKWTVTQLGNGQYSIIGVGSGKALDVFNRSTADSAPIDIYTYSGDNCQKWIITATTGGYYEVIGVGSGKALEVFNQSTADNAPVDQYTYFGGNSQQWAFQAP